MADFQVWLRALPFDLVAIYPLVSFVGSLVTLVILSLRFRFLWCRVSLRISFRNEIRFALVSKFGPFCFVVRLVSRRFFFPSVCGV